MMGIVDTGITGDLLFSRFSMCVCHHLRVPWRPDETTEAPEVGCAGNCEVPVPSLEISKEMVLPLMIVNM